MPHAERRAELLVGGTFVGLALGLALGGAWTNFSVSVAALYVLALAVASNVRFDVGAGFTVPTQAVFVPMLFAVPVSLVPLLTAVALAIGMMPKIVTGRLARSRLLAVPGNSWFAVGPSAVLLLAHDHSPSGRWGVLLAAIAAQLACDFMANAVREGLFDDITIGELATEMREIYVMDLSLTALGLAVAFAAAQTHSQAAAVLLIAPLFGLLRLFSKEREARLQQLVELSDAYHGTALLLGEVVEADDAYTGEHCKGVVQLSVRVVAELELDADKRRNVEFAALLHDVGKIAVPKGIINKAAPLDEGEWAIIRTHTLEGQKLLARVGGFMREIGQIVRSSHERWDGLGYPDGLAAEAIPIEARIVAACDSFNAMTTTRPYRTAMPQPDAIAQLKASAGTQFDPAVVDALLNVFDAPAATSARRRAHELAADRALEQPAARPVQAGA